MLLNGLQKIKTLLVFLVALFLTIANYLFTNIFDTSILVFTAIILFWYTYETSKMGYAVTKQNLLQTRPILLIVLNEPNVLLKNQGRGPALNVIIEKIEVSNTFMKKPGTTEYEIKPISFIPVNESYPFKIWRKEYKSGKLGTIPEMGFFFEFGSHIFITLKYEDIEGNKYKTLINFQSGEFKRISFRVRLFLAACADASTC